jgi:hypothetical protein
MSTRDHFLARLPSERSFKGKGDDIVPALEVQLGVPTRTHDDVLTAVDHAGIRKRIDACTGKKRPKDLTVLRIIGSRWDPLFDRDESVRDDPELTGPSGLLSFCPPRCRSR